MHYTRALDCQMSFTPNKSIAFIVDVIISSCCTFGEIIYESGTTKAVVWNEDWTLKSHELVFVSMAIIILSPP